MDEPSFFNQSLDDEYLWYFFFQAFAINDYTATNNFVHAYFVSLPLHFWNTVLEVGLLGQRAMACVILLDTTKLPPQEALHRFAFLPAVYECTWDKHDSPNFMSYRWKNRITGALNDTPRSWSY